MRKKEGLLEQEAPKPKGREDLLENHTFWLFGFLLFSSVFVTTLLLVVPYADITGQLVKPDIPQSQLSTITNGSSYFNTMQSSAGIILAQKILDAPAIQDKNTVFICRFETDDLKCDGNAALSALQNFEAKRTNKELKDIQKLTAGRFGKGFNANLAYLKIQGIDAPLSPLSSTEGTIDFWVKTSWNGNDNNVYSFIDNRPAGYSVQEYKNAFKIGKFASTANGNYFYFKILDKDGNQIEVNTFANQTIASDWKSNEWHHIAAVWNLGEGKIQLFIDGNKAAERTAQISLYAAASDANLYLGSDKDGNQVSNSTIDELRFSSKARTGEELKNYQDQGYVLLKEFDAGKNVNWTTLNWMDATQQDKGIAYWNFDDNQGNTANEPSGKKGTLKGKDTPSGTTFPKWTRDGIHGTALYFGGDESYIDVPSNESFNLTDFSIEAWIKTSENKEQSIVSTFSLSDANNPTSYNPFYQLRMKSDGKALLEISDKTKYLTLESTNNLADGKWHQIIGIRDTLQRKIVIYVDGKIDKTSQDTTTGNIYPPSALRIGNQKNRDGRNFKGIIDEVKILNKVISPTEVLLSYERALWKTYAQLKFKKEGAEYNSFSGTNAIPHLKNVISQDRKGQLALVTFDNSDTFWQNSAVNTNAEQKPLIVEGKFGSGAKFEAQQSLIYPYRFLNYTEGTIDFWTKLNTDTTALQQTQTLFESGTDKNAIRIYLTNNPSARIIFSIKDKDGNTYEVNKEISWKANEWHHVAIAWKSDNSGNKEMFLFLDKTFASEISSKTNPILFNAQSTTFLIGNSNAKNSPALAALDDFQITNLFRGSDFYETGYTNPSGENLSGIEARYAQARILLTTQDSSLTPAISSLNLLNTEQLPLTTVSGTPTPTPTETPSQSMQLIQTSKPNITYPLQNSYVVGPDVKIKWTEIANTSKYSITVRDRDDSSLRCTGCGNNCANNLYFVCITNISNSTTSLEIPVIDEHHYSAWVETISPSGMINASDYVSFTVNKSVATKTPTPTKTPSPTLTATPSITKTPTPSITTTPPPTKTPQQEKPAPVAPVTSVSKGPSTTMIVLLIIILLLGGVGIFLAFKFLSGNKESEEKPFPEKTTKEPRKTEMPSTREEIKPLEEFEPVEGGIKLSKVEPSVPQELKDYVESFLNKGFTKEQIKKTLINVGWSEDVVEKVLE